MVSLSSEFVKELTLILGDECAARSILGRFQSLAAVYGDAPADAFTARDGLTENERQKRLKLTLAHLENLIPLLDERLAWVTACYLPGFTDGPDVAEQNERRIEALRMPLQELRDDLARALDLAAPVRPGKPFRPTPQVMLMLTLKAELEEGGIAFATGESSKFVRAARVCWGAVGFENDPRDLLRTLAKRGAK